MNNNNLLYRTLSLYFCLLSLLLFFSPAFCQIAGKKIQYYPEHYNTPTIDDNNTPLDISGEVQSGLPWIVFNDDEGNNSCIKPGNDSILKRNLSFLEAFYVIDETEKYIHIVKDDNLDAMNGTLSQYATDYGWINKKNLLLWNRCLVTKNGNISKKAMLIITQNFLKKTNFENIKQYSVNLYKNADRTIPIYYQKDILDIFFIYKIKGSSVLLGANSFTGKNEVSSDLLGWVDKDMLMFWNNRLCIEPNYNSEAANERKNTGFKTTVFYDLPTALKYSTGTNVSSQGWWYADPFKNRLPGHIMRFPVYKIKKITKNSFTNYIAHIGIIGNVINDSIYLEKPDNEELITFYKKLKIKNQNFNLIFVIDGTASMTPYFTSVSEAINNGINKISEAYSEKKINFRFATVFYFYYNNSLSTKTKPLTTKENITDYLQKKYTNKEKAVFQALKNAIISTGLENSNTTNIIILISDANSNIDNLQVAKQEIVDLLVRKNCHIHAYIFNNNNTKQNQNFISQISDLLHSQTLQIYYSNYNDKQVPETDSLIPNNLIFNSSKNTASIYIENQINYNNLKYTIVNSVKSALNFNNSLYSNILDNLMNNMTADNIVSLNESIVNITHTENINPENFSPAFYEYLNKLNISEQILNYIANEKYPLFLKASTPLYIQGLEYPQYKFTLFLNQKELTDLVNIIEKLLNATKGGNRRENMKIFFVELIKEHIGELSEEEQLNMNINEIWRKTIGLSFTGNLLKEYTIAQISDKKIFPNEKITELSNIIQKKYNDLNQIATGMNYAAEIIFETNSGKYYWIGEDLLP